MSLRDDRYFAFDTFAIVAWFFIAVNTQAQWWVFLLPPALLVLDSFRSRYGLVFCILILIAYPFYPMGFTVEYVEAISGINDHRTLVRVGIHSPGGFAAVLGIRAE